MQVPAEIQNLMAEMWADFERGEREREEQRAKADPKAHRLSRVFAGRTGTSYNLLLAGRNGKNQSVWYCWSCHRNVAGYFLGWRQTRRQNGTVKRDQWAARRSRKAVASLAQRRTDRFRANKVAS